MTVQPIGLTSRKAWAIWAVSFQLRRHDGGRQAPEGLPGMGNRWGYAWGHVMGSQNRRKTNKHRHMGNMGSRRERNSAALHSYTTVILI